MGGCGVSGSKGHHILCDFYFFLRSAQRQLLPLKLTSLHHQKPPPTSHQPPPTDIHTCRYGMFRRWCVCVCVCVLSANIWCLFICNFVVVICIQTRFSQIGIESNDCRGTFAVNKAIQFSSSPFNAAPFCQPTNNNEEPAEKRQTGWQTNKQTIWPSICPEQICRNRPHC